MRKSKYPTVEEAPSEPDPKSKQTRSPPSSTLTTERSEPRKKNYHRRKMWATGKKKAHRDMMHAIPNMQPVIPFEIVRRRGTAHRLRKLPSNAARNLRYEPPLWRAEKLRAKEICRGMYKCTPSSRVVVAESINRDEKRCR